jgi:hypothetical protein
VLILWRRSRTEAAGGTCSYQSDIFIIWKRIWGMKVHNSLKNFLWRACHDILPTRDNLKRRGINLDLSCIFCNCEQETVLHILWSCPSASDVWGFCGRQVQKWSNTGNSFVELLDFMFARFDPEEVELFVEIARRLWFRRNDVVHGGYFSHPNEVIGTATALMTEYRSAPIPVHVEREALNGSVEPLMVKWSPPPVGVVKANWDVAVDMKNGKLGYGCVIRDSGGNLQAASYHVEFLTVEFCRDNVFS